MELRRALRTKRPRLGCVLLAIPAALSLSCALGFAASTVPAPDPMPREAVLASLALERSAAEALGFAFEREVDAEHETHEPPDRLELSLGAGECVAVIAAVWGSQSPGRLALRRASDASQVVSEDAEPAWRRVAHVQWCGERAEALTLELERSRDDLFSREGHVAGGSRLVVMRGPASRIGGLERLTRGRVPDAELARLSGHVFDAAAAARRSSTPLMTELAIESFSARLIPEDLATYGVLHEGAANGSSRVVRPRFSPLPESAPRAFRPGLVGTRTAEDLRAQARPSDAAGEPHPAVRQTSEGMARVLAVIDTARLVEPCVELQFVRMAFGYEAPVRRVPATGGSGGERALQKLDNVAWDSVCRSDGTLVYVVPTTDQERYTLRVYPGR
jgi:hypothetical protein